eukprot:jgi/Tetstr1/433010/TSEL_022347.t1
MDKAFRFRLVFLRRLNEIKRVHGDHGYWACCGLTISIPQRNIWALSTDFGDLMRDYERWVAGVDVSVVAIVGEAAEVSMSDMSRVAFRLSCSRFARRPVTFR